MQHVKKYNIGTKIACAHAHWQHGFCESHGGILGEVFDKMVYQFGTKGPHDVKMVLWASTQAKNATLTRNGLTAEQAVLVAP